MGLLLISVVNMKNNSPYYNVVVLLLFSIFSFNQVIAQTDKDITPVPGEEELAQINHSVEGFLELNLEDLLSMKVTSVSKKKQKLKEAAAAIFVISQEDIRRSGVTSIAEALRMAPGVQVARFDANKWAISSRGFNSQFSNKLLVLIDGRSVYTPTFSGVYWDLQDTLLADIDRIEVIRGPGASLWGANAVNGVINIITKFSSDTQGGLVSAGASQEEEGFASLRYGTTLSENSHGRFFLKAFKRDSFVLESDGSDGGDDWEAQRAGFRIDTHSDGPDNWTVQGGCPGSHANQDLSFKWVDPTTFDSSGIDLSAAPGTQTETTERNISTFLESSGWNLLTRWNHVISEQSSTSLQLYYDSTKHKELYLAQVIETLDMDFKHNLTIGQTQQLIWGLGYRHIKDEYENTFQISMNPVADTVNLYNVFVQDQIELLPDQFYLTLGSKFEHNDYTGFEVQPSIRGLWKTSDTSSVWGSVSRAIRMPSRGEYNARIVRFTGLITTGIPAFPLAPVNVELNGNEDFDSEKILAYELGYRIQPLENLSVDLAAFYNDYEDLLTYEQITRESIVFGNKMSGHGYGFEVVLDLRTNAWWKIKAAYSSIKLSLQLDNDSLDMGTAVSINEGSSPEHQITLRSSEALFNSLPVRKSVLKSISKAPKAHG